MTEGRYRIGTVSALFRVAVVFTIGFLINLFWSLITVFSFSIFSMGSGDLLTNSSDMLEQILRSPEYLFFVSIYNIFVIVMVYLFWKYADKCSTAVIGLRWKRNTPQMFGLGILGGTLEMAFIMLLSFSMGTLWFQGYGSEIFSTAEILKSFFYGILAFLLVGFGEEALFRGYIQKRLMHSMGNGWALLLSSLIFMAAHILTYGKLLDFIDVALGGAVLGYLYILTDSLYLPAAYHFVYDLIQVNVVRIQEYEHYKGGVMYIFGNTGDIIVSGFNYGNVIEVSFVIVELVVLFLLYVFRNKIKRLAY